jgi:hypothetical protein
MTDMLPTEDDQAFDRGLAALMAQDPVETAPLSRAVLSRLAQDSVPRPAYGEVLALPVPLGLAFGGLLVLAGAAGYAALPLVTGEELPLLMVLGESLRLGGGF